MIQIRMRLVTRGSSRLCEKVFGSPHSALPQVPRGSQEKHFTSPHLSLLMAKRERATSPLPESLQTNSPELQECKTVTVNGSSQAERKIQPVKRAA